MAGRGPQTDAPKDTHVTLRIEDETVDYLDALGEAWGLTRNDGEVNRSEVLRTVINTHNGILFGNFFGIIDNDALADEWGEIGHVLAAANEAERGLPAGLQTPRLADVLEPIPLLMSAAEVELSEVEATDAE